MHPRHQPPPVSWIARACRAACFCLLLAACQQSPTPPTPQQLLARAIAQHDPEGQWESMRFHAHIQEPRVANTQRYSIVDMDNASGAFSLSRNRGAHVARYALDAQGNSSVWLDGKQDFADSTAAKYRLDTAMVRRYRGFYHFMYGLPMVLGDTAQLVAGEAQRTMFQGQPCYQVALEANHAPMSKHWRVYIGVDTPWVRGVDIVFPAAPEKGERIVFGLPMSVGGVWLPRARHWHGLADGQYGGTDIVMKLMAD